MYRAKHNGYSDHNYPTLAGQSRDSLSHTSPVNTSDNISGGFTKLCWIVLQNRSISCNTGAVAGAECNTVIELKLEHHAA